ncbi:LPS export ABC transporter periplasmic protein LptC [Sphingomonas sp.]|uniref:LPS export ABC transporter periplasmic protein LptC n=1 Tax=Sphingomonas sp. TaxID=28214 RepID=UPI00286CD455|nr:LPS export ABC transporter periplasmic protein LptC [Sphingomonas sp.]
MSEAATRERAFRQLWAVPGSRHDRLVRFAKAALPSAVGVLIAVLAFAPLHKEGDASFILDKTKVGNAPERMKVEAARYVGEDNKGQKFLIEANTAVQRSSQVPIVDISGMMARLALEQGPLMIMANLARYDLDSQKIAIRGPVRVTGPDGYRLETRDVLVDLKQHHLSSPGPVAGAMRLGQFRAGNLSADLDERTVVLGGGARLKIVQGAVN